MAFSFDSKYSRILAGDIRVLKAMEGVIQRLAL
jgi:hypothetical protein